MRVQTPGRLVARDGRQTIAIAPEVQAIHGLQGVGRVEPDRDPEALPHPRVDPVEEPVGVADRLAAAAEREGEHGLLAFLLGDQVVQRVQDPGGGGKILRIGATLTVDSTVATGTHLPGFTVTIIKE